MNDARIQQIADPLTIATRPETELVARFMGDNNIISGEIASKDGDHFVIEHDGVRVRAAAGDDTRQPGDRITVSIRAASVELDLEGSGGVAPNSADCEIVFVEFLGDLVKLHLMAGKERMLAKVPGDEYPTLRGREGQRIRISWKEEDVKLLRG